MKRKTLYAVVMAALLAFGGTALADDTATLILCGDVGPECNITNTVEGELELSTADSTLLVVPTNRDASFELNCNGGTAEITVSEPVAVSADAVDLKNSPGVVEMVILRDASYTQLCASTSGGCSQTGVGDATYRVAIQYDSNKDIPEGHYEFQVTVNVVDE